MAKSKNHTAHNQTYKSHRNGITRVARRRYTSLKGVDAKFVRNLRRAKRNNNRNAQKKESTAIEA